MERRIESIVAGQEALPETGVGRVRESGHLAPGTRFAVDAYVTFAREKPWVEAVASGLTGSCAARAIQRRLMRAPPENGRPAH